MEQIQALKIMRSGKNCFITGRAGTGKTYLLNQFIGYLNEKKIPAGITASTGISATHIDGQTIHSWSGIGIADKYDEVIVQKAARRLLIKERVKISRVLIIDEVSMLHDFQLDMVNAICKKVKENNLPFGGLQVVLCGDFYQLPPVSKRYHRGEFITNSSSWNELNLEVCYLEKTYRQQQDEPLLKLLNEIRENSVSEQNTRRLIERVDYAFDKDITTTKLYTNNIDADAYNLGMLSKIKNKEHRFIMQKSGEPENVRKLAQGCLAPETLILKKDAVVMFLKNNPAKGYVNGTTGKVVDFDEEGYPIIKVFKNKKRITALPADWDMEDNLKIIAKITQVPLKLAWAITVHKSQGMTLDYAQIDLSKAFTYSLGYVALSRVRSIESLSLRGFNKVSLKVSEEALAIDEFLKKPINKEGAAISDQALKESTVAKEKKEIIQESSKIYGKQSVRELQKYHRKSLTEVVSEILITLGIIFGGFIIFSIIFWFLLK